MLLRRGQVGRQASGAATRGPGSSSCCRLQGNCSQKRSVFFTDTSMFRSLTNNIQQYMNNQGTVSTNGQRQTGENRFRCFAHDSAPVSRALAASVSYHIMSCHVIAQHVINYNVASQHRLSYHIISCHVIAQRSIAQRSMSAQVTSRRALLHHSAVLSRPRAWSLSSLSWAPAAARGERGRAAVATNSFVLPSARRFGLFTRRLDVISGFVNSISES